MRGFAVGASVNDSCIGSDIARTLAHNRGMPKLPTWEDVKKVADEVEKKVQSAGAAAREKWNTQLRPKVAEVGKKIEDAGHRAGDAIQQQVSALSEALSKLQHEIAEDLKIGRKPKDITPADAPTGAKPDEPKPDDTKP
jgi:hypothetical protein